MIEQRTPTIPWAAEHDDEQYVSANAGGCWVCNRGATAFEEPMSFDMEFDTFYHRECLDRLGLDSIMEFEGGDWESPYHAIENGSDDITDLYLVERQSDVDDAIFPFKLEDWGNRTEPQHEMKMHRDEVKPLVELLSSLSGEIPTEYEAFGAGLLLGVALARYSVERERELPDGFDWCVRCGDPTDLEVPIYLGHSSPIDFIPMCGGCQ